MKAQPTDNEILSVGAYTRQIKALLEKELPESWIRGEVSNLRRQSSGHVYFTLKDKESQLACVLFRGDAYRQTVELKDGLQVVLFGNISVFEPRGNYQLITRFVLADGVGRLQLEFERLKQKLLKEGLFDEKRKRPLPTLPQTVGFVTSPTGAAVRDFLKILQRRGWRGRVVIFPAKVQGQGAAQEIVDMIEKAHQLAEVDVLVVGRGGGSLEDLWPFNEEPVARAVAGSSIPVISAVGHEIDFTLSDFAADVRAETPSAAAELVTSGYLAVAERYMRLRDHLLDAAVDVQESKAYAVERLASRLKLVSPQHRLEQAALRLDDLRNRLEATMSERFAKSQASLAALQHRLAMSSPENRLRLARMELTGLDKRYFRQLLRGFSEERKQLKTLEKRLHATSLSRTLMRGFAVVRDEQGNLVARKEGLKPGQRLSNDFADGEIVVKVTDV